MHFYGWCDFCFFFRLYFFIQMKLCLFLLVLTTHAADEATKRIQVFDDVDKAVSTGQNTVLDFQRDTEPRQTEHQPIKVAEIEHEKLVTVIKRVISSFNFFPLLRIFYTFFFNLLQTGTCSNSDYKTWYEYNHISFINLSIFHIEYFIFIYKSSSIQSGENCACAR